MDESIVVNQNCEFSTPKPTKSHLQRVVALTPSGFKSPAVRIPPTPFLKRLGYGTGVDVFLYERSPAKPGAVSSPWALKRLRKSTAISAEKDQSISRRLENEAGILKRLKHPNIIGFRGFKNTDRGQILMMEDGEISLMDLIEDRQDLGDGPFPAADIEKTILGVARALDYLHTEIRLLHGDLKSGNVLIKDDFQIVKLCDFGVTVRLGENLMAVDGEKYIGTDPWSAPEVLNEEPFGSPADIFSLGLVVYEMLTCEMPHVHVSDMSLSEESFTDSDSSFGVPDVSDKFGTRPELPIEFVIDDSYYKVMQIFVACTEQDPKHRPTARDIVKLLTE